MMSYRIMLTDDEASAIVNHLKDRKLNDKGFGAFSLKDKKLLLSSPRISIKGLIHEGFVLLNNPSGTMLTLPAKDGAHGAIDTFAQIMKNLNAKVLFAGECLRNEKNEIVAFSNASSTHAALMRERYSSANNEMMLDPAKIGKRTLLPKDKFIQYDQWEKGIREQPAPLKKSSSMPMTQKSFFSFWPASPAIQISVKPKNNMPKKNP